MYNPYKTWKRYHFEGNLFDSENVAMLFDEDHPIAGGFDTETTGLHIKKDKPFLIQFGWLVPGEEWGRVITFYPTEANMRMFFLLAKKLKYLVAHNIGYDLHMVSNIGYAEQVQSMTNLVENMSVARLSLEAIPAREGGDSLQLKSLGKKYVHPDATRSESMIKDALKEINDERIKVLASALKQFDLEGELTPTGKQKKWGKKAVEDFLKDPTNDIEDLPEDVREVWLDWNKEYPEPTYEDVNREIMIKYGGEDIITMMEFFKKAMKTVIERDQLGVLERENKFILPKYRMERVGFKADRTYLEESRLRVKDYITKLRKEMYSIAGAIINTGQHDKIKGVFRSKWGIHLESDDKAALKFVEKTYDGEAKRYATLIKALRSLEKWYSTYIRRILDVSSYDGHVYTQINQAGAVSGRMSSDFQQFPKKALYDLEGNELYHPRKAFVVKGEGYNEITYIDYDQIELVTQAHYTLLVSGGDHNLCRAYMPFECHHYKTGETYNYRDAKERSRYDEAQEDGKSAWLDENGEPWVRTDVHSETTHKAFPHIPLGTDEFKEWRSKGKIFNFLANYGGGKGAAIKQLDLKDDEADALVKGYAESFPHVKIYQEAIVRAYGNKGYVHNLYGRRYYLTYARIAYKLANYNIQGTCADALKEAIIRLDAYILENNLKTKIVMPIHDEIIFDTYAGEEHHKQRFLEIMQEAFDWCLVPVSAGVEVTYTTWAAKKEN